MPAHAVTAPVRGSGKTLLQSVASTLATGTSPAVVDWSSDDAEASKRLDGMLLAGDDIFMIDNIEAVLESAPLCQILTQPVRRIRPLGRSAMFSMNCNRIIFLNGNNLILRGDIVRRALVCHLDAMVERPELRNFDQDILEECHRRRGELVADAQTIVAAFLAAGCPGQNVKRLGSFEAWSDTVREALIWAGAADPCASMERSTRPSHHARCWRRSQLPRRWASSLFLFLIGGPARGRRISAGIKPGPTR